MQFCSKEDIKDYIETRKADIKKSVQKNTSMGFDVPTLAIIQVGSNPASNKYVNGKIKDCEEVGMKAVLHKFNEDIEPVDFGTEIIKIMHDEMIHGVIIQKPLPEKLEKYFDKFVKMIPKKKDVDGFRKDTEFDPCTPKGVVDYIESRQGKDWLTGKDVVIINRTELVGRPLAKMMLDRNATVTVCHSKTERLRNHCQYADIVVSAIGKPKILIRDYVKHDSVCFDVGISFDENGKMCGDFDRDNVMKITDYCTPVPGGVGLLTRIALVENVLKAYENQKYRASMIPNAEKDENNVGNYKSYERK